MPKVTVYIPTHNYRKYILKAIESVIGQTFDDWELIVVDDGSTDGTSVLLNKYSGHPKIRIVEQENHGLNVTNNIAMRLSRGKYLIRLDADDYMDENLLMVLSSVLDDKPEVGLVYPDYFLVDEDGNILEMVRRKKIGEEDEIFDLPAHGACTMIRKECLLLVGGYSEKFTCQDGFDLWIKMIPRFQPYNVNIPLFYYRRHGNNLTDQKEKVLATRGEIKRDYIRSNTDITLPKVLGLVLAVGRSVYPHSGPFVELAGEPLINYTLKELQFAATLDKIVVSSEDDRVLEHALQFPGVSSVKRSLEHAKATSRTEEIVQEVLEHLKVTVDYEPDAVCVLFINTPLRRATHIDRAVHALTIFQTESVISVQEELGQLYFHRKFGLEAIRTSKEDVRLEREALYRGNGAIFLSMTEVFKRNSLLGKKVGHIVMLPEESVKTNSLFDFWLAERILIDRKNGNQLV